MPEETDVVVADATETPYNPFLRVKAAFAATLPTERFDFTLEGEECYVVVGAMDAEAFGEYRRVLEEIQMPTEMLRNPHAMKDGHLKLSPDLQKAGMVLLLNSVRGFKLPRFILKGGKQEPSPLVFAGSGKSRDELRQIYRTLTPELFDAMVEAALTVNHLDPNALAGMAPNRGAAPSATASTDSEPPTSTP